VLLALLSCWDAEKFSPLDTCKPLSLSYIVLIGLVSYFVIFDKEMTSLFPPFFWFYVPPS